MSVVWEECPGCELCRPSRRAALSGALAHVRWQQDRLAREAARLEALIEEERCESTDRPRSSSGGSTK